MAKKKEISPEVRAILEIKEMRKAAENLLEKIKNYPLEKVTKEAKEFQTKFNQAWENPDLKDLLADYEMEFSQRLLEETFQEMEPIIKDFLRTIELIQLQREIIPDVERMEKEVKGKFINQISPLLERIAREEREIVNKKVEEKWQNYLEKTQKERKRLKEEIEELEIDLQQLIREYQDYQVEEYPPGKEPLNYPGYPVLLLPEEGIGLKPTPSYNVSLAKLLKLVREKMGTFDRLKAILQKLPYSETEKILKEILLLIEETENVLAKYIKVSKKEAENLALVTETPPKIWRELVDNIATISFGKSQLYRVSLPKREEEE